jgi:ATP synthase protein I
MVDRADKDRLAELSERIRRAKGAQAPVSKMEEHHSQAHLAWRMVIELVAGIVIGFGIGYALDVLLGTMPIFLVLFVLLGFAAGVRVMMRSVRELQIEGAAQDERVEHGGNGAEK